VIPVKSMTKEPPVLVTPRLRLRAHKLSDFETIVDLWSDPEVVRFISGEPLSREQTWSRLLRTVGHWKVLGFGYWGVEAKEDERLIGEVGLANFQRDLAPSRIGIPEAGWALTTKASGRGLATEAMSAVFDWADATIDVPQTFAFFDPNHAASIRVAQKLGFRDPEPMEFQRKSVVVMYRPRTEKILSARKTPT